jgi:5'(3')-deoxyribonucleotidase
MKIGIDVDGVLRDFVGELTRCFKRDYPKLADKVMPVTAWDMHPFFGMEKDVFNAYWQNIRGPEIMGNARMIDAAAPHFIAALRKAGHKVVVASAQWPNVHAILPAWLQAHGIEYDGLCIVADKSILALDVLLDDGEHNLSNVHAGCVPVCFNQPWNYDWKGERVWSFEQFAAFVYRKTYEAK